MSGKSEQIIKKVIKKVRIHKFILLSVIFAFVLTFVLISSERASNMGFKLNYGIVNALNKILLGSGISFSQEESGEPPETDLIMNLDLNNTKFMPQSNMGFKLNVISLPAEGIEVLAGGRTYIVKMEDGNLSIIGPQSAPPKQKVSTNLWSKIKSR